MPLRLLRIALRFLWGAFLLLTSLYCLLAFLPYTYSAMIKAPPYTWVPWSVTHYTALYWVALTAAACALLPLRKSPTKLALLAAYGLVGIYITFRPFMAFVQPNWATFFWAV